MEISFDSLDTPALTKAHLSEMLFEQLGLNKREAKDYIEAFFEVSFWTKPTTSLHISFSKLCRQLIAGSRAVLASKRNKGQLLLQFNAGHLSCHGVLACID